MNILHIAPFNTAGVPMTLVRAERRMGHNSRLITMGWDKQSRESDIVLNLPFLDSGITRFAKQRISPAARLEVSCEAFPPDEIPVCWAAGNRMESILFNLRERIWEPRVRKMMDRIGFWDFDLYELDGGLEFFRNGRTVQALKDKGKRVICCYTGSDLRTRGVIPEIDRLSDANITVEFDHLQWHPRISHVPFPADIDSFEYRYSDPVSEIRIGHAPTNRMAKGSDFIIPCIRSLEREYPVKMVLIENLSYREALARKGTCHLFIDQIGNLGYGMNAVEALAMGIPTGTSLAEGFTKQYTDHPFFEIKKDNLKETILSLIHSGTLLRRRSLEGRKWVERVHDFITVAARIHTLAGIVEEQG